MSIPRLFVLVLVAVVTLGVAAPAAASDAPGSSAKASNECVNIAVEYAAERLGVFVSLFGVVGVGVASPHPGDGIAFGVFFLPDVCAIGVPEVMGSVPPEPPLPKDPVHWLLS